MSLPCPAKWPRYLATIRSCKTTRSGHLISGELSWIPGTGYKMLNVSSDERKVEVRLFSLQSSKNSFCRFVESFPAHAVLHAGPVSVEVHLGPPSTAWEAGRLAGSDFQSCQQPWQLPSSPPALHQIAGSQGSTHTPYLRSHLAHRPLKSVLKSPS